MCLAVPALVTELLHDSMAKISLDGVSMTISVALVKNVAVAILVDVFHRAPPAASATPRASSSSSSVRRASSGSTLDSA